MDWDQKVPLASLASLTAGLVPLLSAAKREIFHNVGGGAEKMASPKSWEFALESAKQVIQASK